MARSRVGSPVGVALVAAVLAALVTALVLSFVLDDSGADEAATVITLDPNADVTITAPPNTAVGETADDFTYEPLDGGDELDFATERDGRPAVVNFFRHDCAPCVIEMPDLEQGFQEHGDEVAFFGFSYGESVDDGQAFVARTGATYAIGRDPTGEILAGFEGAGLPTTVFLDADGTITAVHTGRVTASELEEELGALTA